MEIFVSAIKIIVLDYNFTREKWESGLKLLVTSK